MANQCLFWQGKAVAVKLSCQDSPRQALMCTLDTDSHLNRHFYIVMRRHTHSSMGLSCWKLNNTMWARSVSPAHTHTHMHMHQGLLMHLHPNSLPGAHLGCPERRCSHCPRKRGPGEGRGRGGCHCQGDWSPSHDQGHCRCVRG